MIVSFAFTTFEYCQELIASIGTIGNTYVIFLITRPARVWYRWLHVDVKDEEERELQRSPCPASFPQSSVYELNLKHPA